MGYPPHFVEEAPCQEVVVNNPVILEQLPIPRFFERETGPYISAGLIIAKNPVTGKKEYFYSKM